LVFFAPTRACPQVQDFRIFSKVSFFFCLGRPTPPLLDLCSENLTLGRRPRRKSPGFFLFGKLRWLQFFFVGWFSGGVGPAIVRGETPLRFLTCSRHPPPVLCSVFRAAHTPAHRLCFPKFFFDLGSWFDGQIPHHFSFAYIPPLQRGPGLRFGTVVRLVLGLTNGAFFFPVELFLPPLLSCFSG